MAPQPVSAVPAIKCWLVLGCIAVFPVAGVAGAVGDEFRSPSTAALKTLSVEELMDVEITSVSKRGEKLAGAPASIYVIHAQNIRRSGVTTLQEALRLAPNLQVARRDPAQYAISARGFNNTIGNKLLVLIDGRTVYTPLFSGVFWDQQEVLLEDVERIEVISGPGAALWGANAVNGVINVITRQAAETQGTLVAAASGDTERRVSLRHGGTAGTHGAYRLYGVFSEWDRMNQASGAANLNAWERGQVGFRADWAHGQDAYTLQADAYQGETEHRGIVGPFEVTPIDVAGANVLGRWTRQLAGGGEVRLQAYYDHTQREEVVLFSPRADVFDVDFQHRTLRGAHTVTWGGGYRYARDEVQSGFFSRFIPQSRHLDWANAFVQDEIALTESLTLTMGVKLEDNDYTGIQHLPSARLAWKPFDRHLIWGSLSRAVRIPSRFDRDVFFPVTGPPFIVAGGPDFVSEIAKVAELGYRFEPTEAVNGSITVFHHDWNHLRSGTPLPLPTSLTNNIRGAAYGVEMWASWQVAGPWQLSGGLSTLHKDLRFRAGATDTVGTENVTLHNDPDYQWMLRSSFDLPARLELDIHLRGVDALTVQPVPGYTELDVRLAWLALPRLELSLVGRNLMHENHAEFGALPARGEIGRSVLGRFVWEF
jgi:iron complex outermembrane receptor protein